MKFNETQKNLIALLPAHEIINKLTDSAKLVLAQIDLLHGTDFAMENGYVFTTNEQLCKDTGIRARQTVITAVKVLRKLKLIELESGGRHKANRYKLTDLYYELSGDENPFKNQAKECENQAKEMVPKNKNQAVDIELEPELEIIQGTIVHVTEDKNENTMNDMKYNDEFITENDRDAWEVLSMNDYFDYTQYSDIAEIVKRDAGSSKCNENKNKSMYDERNVWITNLFEKLDSTLNLLSQCYDKSLVAGKDGYGATLNRLFNSGDSKIEAGWFTEKQLCKYQGYINRYNGLMKDRRERFGIKDKNVSNAMTASNENSIISDGKSESDEGGGFAAPQFTEEKYMDALKEVFKDWNLFIYCSQVGYGLYDYRKKVADILGTDIVNINESKFERDVKGMFIPITANEPMVAYG